MRSLHESVGVPSKVDIPLLTTSTRLEVGKKPSLMIKPSTNHVAFWANASWLQNVNFARALIGAVISSTDYKEVCTSFEDAIRRCHESRYEVILRHFLTKWLNNFGFPFSLCWLALCLDGGDFLPSTRVNLLTWAVFLTRVKGKIAAWAIITISTSGAQESASKATSHEGSSWGRSGEIHYKATFKDIKVNEYKANLAKVREKLELECKAKNEVE